MTQELTTMNRTNTDRVFSFPKPTGNYAIGTTSYDFVDPEREEIYTEDPNDKREITAKVWYPSEKVSGAATAPYMSEELSRAIASELGLPPEDFVNVTQSIQTNSFADAPVAKAESEYPVLFFSHGGADLPELHSIKAEELASQGYVVVAINHTYDSTANVFSDGRVVTQSSIFDLATRDDTPPEIDARSTNITAQDAQFVLDELEKFNAGSDPKGLFDGKLDLERVGIFGFSLGGATSAKTLAEDSRFKAGINIDGGLFGDSGQGSLSQPFMFLNAESFDTVNSSDPTSRKFARLQQSVLNNLQNEGYEVDIEGTKHLDLTDMSFFLPLIENSGIDISDIEPILYPDLTDNNEANFQPLDPQLSTQITKDYITAFFDRHLNNQKTPLLNDFDSPYPEVTFQSYLEGEEINPDSNPPEPNFGTVNADVLEIDSTNQLIFAGNGNDLIDATASVGNNRIYGGDGDDTLILRTGDRLIAGAGDDRFFAGDGGNNTLTGGEGADQFWIAAGQTPTSPNIITDYNPTEDVIGVAGLGIGFEELNLAQQGDDVLIQASGSDLAIFQGITTDSLSSDNFAFA